MNIKGGEDPKKNGFRGYSIEKDKLNYNKSKNDVSINQKKERGSKKIV